MKKIILFSALFLMSIAAKSQDGLTKYFDQYLEDERFTVVYITPKMFQMVSKLKTTDEGFGEMKDILQDLRGLRILTTDKTPKIFYEEAIAKFKTTDYELLMSIRDKGQNVRFWTKEAADGTIAELLLLVGGEKEFVMISFIGKIDLNKISKLADKMDVKGIDQLKNVNKKSDE
jgi:hypothetical protein